MVERILLTKLADLRVATDSDHESEGISLRLTSPTAQLLGITERRQYPEIVKILAIAPSQIVLPLEKAEWSPPADANGQLIAFSSTPPNENENEQMHPWFLLQVAILLGDASAQTRIEDAVKAKAFSKKKARAAASEEKRAPQRVFVGSLWHTYNQAVLLKSTPDLTRYHSGTRQLLDMVALIELKCRGFIDDEAIVQACKYGARLLTVHPHRTLCFICLLYTSDAADE